MHAFTRPVHPGISITICRGAGRTAGVIGSVTVSQGVVPGGFIPRSRDTHKIGSQSRQLADIGNARHIRDQLVHDGQGRDRRINRRSRGHDQDHLVLSSRAPLGRGSVGPTPAMMTFRDPRWVTTAERVWRRMLADVFDDRLPDIESRPLQSSRSFLAPGRSMRSRGL
jgi:hypothetical protein